MSNDIPTPVENPTGLHGRYQVSKTNGEPTDERAIYFVLRIDEFGDDPEHIEACRAAAFAYCDYVQSGRCPHLAKIGVDLRALLRKQGTPRPYGVCQLCGKRKQLMHLQPICHDCY